MTHQGRITIYNCWLLHNGDGRVYASNRTSSSRHEDTKPGVSKSWEGEITNCENNTPNNPFGGLFLAYRWWPWKWGFEPHPPTPPPPTTASLWLFPPPHLVIFFLYELLHSSVYIKERKSNSRKLWWVGRVISTSLQHILNLEQNEL